MSRVLLADGLVTGAHEQPSTAIDAYTHTPVDTQTQAQTQTQHNRRTRSR